MLERELMIQRSYTPPIGEHTLKGNDERTVDLTPAAVEPLEDWVAACGSPDEGLVFPHPAGGYLSPTTITLVVLYG